jgi:hypothetical protein
MGALGEAISPPALGGGSARRWLWLSDKEGGEGGHLGGGGEGSGSRGGPRGERARLYNGRRPLAERGRERGAPPAERCGGAR